MTSVVSIVCCHHVGYSFLNTHCAYNNCKNNNPIFTAHLAETDYGLITGQHAVLPEGKDNPFVLRPVLVSQILRHGGRYAASQFGLIVKSDVKGKGKGKRGFV